MAKKDDEKNKRLTAPAPTYKKIEASGNKGYTRPTVEKKSNIVVSQSDLTPQRTQVQERHPIQVRGALAALQPKKPVYDQPQPPPKGWTPPSPTPPTGYLVNNPVFNPQPVQPQSPEQWKDTTIQRIAGAAPQPKTPLPSVAFGKYASNPNPQTANEYLQSARPGIKPELPGRDIPVVGPILRFGDKVADAVLPFDQGAAATMGVIMPDGLSVQDRPLNGPLDKALYVGGIIGGGLTNPAALEQNLITAPYKAAGALVGSKLGQRAVNRITSVNPALSNVGVQLTPNAVNRGLTGALAGAGTGAAYSLISGQQSAPEVARNALLGGALGGVGDVALGALGGAVSRLLKRNAVPDEQVQEILALPMGREDAARLNRQNNIQTPDVITPDAPILGLPSPRIEPPTTARIQRQTNPYREQFEDLIREAQQREAAGGLSPGREDLELEQMWASKAGPEGVSLDDLIKLAYPSRKNRIQPGLVQKIKQYQSAREVAGAPMPVKSMSDRYKSGQLGIPESPVPTAGRAPTAQQGAQAQRVKASSRTRIEPRGALNQEPSAANAQKIGELSANNQSAQSAQKIVDAAQAKADSTPAETPLTRPDVDDTAIVRGSMDTPPADTPRFTRTVKASENASPELQRAISEAKITAKRTTDQRNLELAEKLITRDGIESAADRIINKKGTLNAVENTAAQVIAKYYSDTGQLERAIQIISKTAVSGRELGQAIQALTRWNKMSVEGAIMLAERQLNRLTTKTEQWQTIKPEQAMPVEEAAKKLESIQAAKQLADDVTKMMVDRQKGAPFSADERDLIQRFSEQIRKTSEEVRPLVKKQNAENNQAIAEVSRVKPKERTRDQVQRLITAQADKARERLKKSRTRLSSTPLDVWRDYIIVGADYITQKAVKFADWSEAMIKEGITENLGRLYVDSVRKFRKENGLPTSDELDRVIKRALKENKVDEETANSLQAMASEIGFFADDVKLEMTQELQRAMRSLGASTLGEKVASVQTSAMLLSVPTFLRNTLGNAGQMLLEKINKVIAVPIDWGFSKLTGERTIQLLPKNQEKLWRNFGIGAKAGWTGIDPQGSLNSYNLTPNVIQSNRNPFKWLTQLTGASLKSGDYAAYMSAYGDLVATYAGQIGKAQGLTKAQIKEQMPQLIKQLDDRIYEMADQAGLYATYQDETLLSKGAQKVKSFLNAPTDAAFRSLREKGLSHKLSLEGFGAGDVVLKFAKTPANLVMRGIDYSPIGFVRGLYELLPLIPALAKRGATFNQYQATRSLSRAITGTLGLTGLGYYLADKGILTGAASANPSIRSLQEQTGQGAYKANLSALTRFIMSGFDDEAAKYQKGDVLMDYNWIQPAAISIGMGVNLAESLNKPEKPGNATPEWKKYAGAVLGGLRTVLENPMVTGLQNVVDASAKAISNPEQGVSEFTNIAKGIPASFVPAVAGQWRSGKDQLQRETSDQNPFVAMLNMMKNKLPYLSDNLPVSYDSLGNERKRYNYVEPNTLASYLNQFFNPARFSTYDVSPDAQLILDVLEQTNDTGVIPKVGKRYLTYTDPQTNVEQRVNLTNEEFSDLQNRMGSLVSENIMKNEQYLSNPNVTGENKVKAIEKILREAGQKARNEYRKKMGYPLKRE